MLRKNTCWTEELFFSKGFSIYRADPTSSMSGNHSVSAPFCLKYPNCSSYPHSNCDSLEICSHTKYPLLIQKKSHFKNIIVFYYSENLSGKLHWLQHNDNSNCSLRRVQLHVHAQAYMQVSLHVQFCFVIITYFL